MSRSGFKSQLFQHFARIGKALSNANRLEILEFLAQGEHSVESLAQKAGLSIANTSQHLQQLKQISLVEARKQGLHVYYRLSGNDVIELMKTLRQVGESHLADVDQLIRLYLNIKDSLEPIPASELLERARQHLVTVIDVRPSDEYAAGHLPDAINIPLAELETRLGHLETGKEVVAYCRGPHCILAYEAVHRLREKGLKARRLEDGFPEWKAAGYPVEL